VKTALAAGVLQKTKRADNLTGVCLRPACLQQAYPPFSRFSFAARRRATSGNLGAPTPRCGLYLQPAKKKARRARGKTWGRPGPRRGEPGEKLDLVNRHYVDDRVVAADDHRAPFHNNARIPCGQPRQLPRQLSGKRLAASLQIRSERPIAA